MTVSNELSTAGPYTGNDSTTEFSFSFKTFLTADLTVLHYDTTTSTETVLTEGDDYTVSLNADQEANPGGSVTYPVSGSPATTTEKITLVRTLDYLQSLDLVTGGAFNAANIETALDKVVMMIQQIKDDTERALRLPSSLADSIETALSGLAANNYLRVNPDGDAIIGSESLVAGEVTITSFMETVLDDTTASAARATLGALGSADTIDADTVNSLEAAATAQANKLLALDGSSKLPASITGDADSVDGIHAAASAQANKLCALNGSSKLPADITGDADTVDGQHASAFATTSHSHSGTVERSWLKTSTVSLNGTITAGNQVYFTLNSYPFFPMIHTTDYVPIVGHNSDGASPDNPRFGINNTSGGSVFYDVDYRYVNT